MVFMTYYKYTRMSVITLDKIKNHRIYSNFYVEEQKKARIFEVNIKLNLFIQKKTIQHHDF